LAQALLPLLNPQELSWAVAVAKHLEPEFAKPLLGLPLAVVAGEAVL
tara:strand:+ start:418 stop:558 length:141 start_codon:yes stop_codon:yes gene_type:complete